MSDIKNLGSAITSNSDGSDVTITWNGDRALARINAYGTFDTATVTGQIQIPGTSTYATIEDINGNGVTFTAAGVGQAFYICNGDVVRVNVSSVGGSTSVSADIQKIGKA